MSVVDLWGVALGGALGIIGTAIGQYISGRRQNQQWRFENKKQEYRELLDAMSKAVRFIVDANNGSINVGAQVEEAAEAHDNVFRVIEDRIFIAETVRKEEFMDRWVEIAAKIQNRAEIIELYTTLRAKVLRAAFDELGIKYGD